MKLLAAVLTLASLGVFLTQFYQASAPKPAPNEFVPGARPPRHEQQVLAAYPQLKHAERMPTCGMGENYAFRIKSKNDYDKLKQQLQQRPWAMGSTIVHEWHTDPSRNHLVVFVD